MSINVTQLFNNINSTAENKGITPEHLSDILKEAIEKAYIKENPEVKIEARINLEKKTISLVEIKKIVNKSEEEIDDDIEINLEEAQKIKKTAKLDDLFEIDVDINKIERRIVMHILQIFQQKLNEITNLKIYEEWKDKEGLVVYAEVEKNDNLRNAEVKLNNDFGVVNKSDQIPNEKLNPGQKYYFLIKEVKQQSKGWPIILSRNNPLLIQHLMAAHVPEIYEGIIKMELIARVPGYKTKIAVSCTDENIDPVGTCVGKSGSRIIAVSNLVNKEKIDVFAYDKDPKQLIINMCAPEKIVGLEITDDTSEDGSTNKIVTIVCNDESVEKIIGKAGINVRLMSMLTGWSIDVISLSLAIEDQIEYEDVSHLSPYKFNSYMKRQGLSSFSNNSSQQKSKFKPFASSLSQGFDDFDYDIEENDNWGSKVTEEDVENLLNTNSKTSKRKRKFDDDDEEVIFISSKDTVSNFENEQESFDEDKTFVENSHEKQLRKETSFFDDESFDHAQNAESLKSQKQELPNKPKQSIDEFFDSYQEPETKKKSKKDSKPKFAKSSSLIQDKKEKKKINVLDEFDISEDDFDDSNNNNIDLDNINIDDDYEE